MFSDSVTSTGHRVSQRSTVTQLEIKVKASPECHVEIKVDTSLAAFKLSCSKKNIADLQKAFDSRHVFALVTPTASNVISVDLCRREVNVEVLWCR